jgi:hypothetical protein
MPHDLAKNVDLFRQAVEGPHRPLALFIGAGCPMSVESANSDGPLIPDITGMTKILTASLKKSKSAKNAFAKLQAVLDEDFAHCRNHRQRVSKTPAVDKDSGG